MSKLTDRRQVNLMIILFAVTYMVSYLTRINYGAVISEMVVSTGFGKTALSAAVTGSFITYGAGQIISGFFGDKFEPKTLVFWGLLVTVSMNVLIPVCTDWMQMTVVWCINGFAQAFMWPPLVRLMANLFSGDDYKRACVVVSWGSSFGTIIIYLIASALIPFAGWRGMFWFSATCGIVMAIVWQKCCCRIEDKVIVKPDAAVQSGNGKFFSAMLFFIMIAIVLQGALRDGVTTWMPTFISETYDMSSQVSILTGVIMPIFGILCFQIATAIYKKMPENPLLCAGIVFAAGAASSLGLCFTVGSNAFASVLFSALLTGSMHGVNLILICMLPQFYENTGKISLISGIINSCVYIGSALSTYGIAYVSEIMGWGATIYMWLGIALAGTLICFMCIPAWKKFLKKTR